MLLLLCALFSVLTLADQHPAGEAAARQLASEIGKLGLQLEYGLDDPLQFRPFLAQCLGMFGLVPDIGLAQFAFYLG